MKNLKNLMINLNQRRWFLCSETSFEAYITDKTFKDIIDNKRYAELNVHPSGGYFKKLPENLREEIPVYIKDNIDLEKFINAWWCNKKKN